MNLPYWPFTVYFMYEIELPGIPFIMYVLGQKEGRTQWQWATRLEENADSEMIGRLFGIAMIAFERAADRT